MDSPFRPEPRNTAYVQTLSYNEMTFSTNDKNGMMMMMVTARYHQLHKLLLLLPDAPPAAPGPILARPVSVPNQPRVAIRPLGAAVTGSAAVLPTWGAPAGRWRQTKHGPPHCATGISRANKRRLPTGRRINRRQVEPGLPAALRRTSPLLRHPKSLLRDS